MKRTIPHAALLLILWLPGITPAAAVEDADVGLLARLDVLASKPALAADGERQKAGANVNTRYDVETASVSGVAESKIRRALRDDMQALVGRKYDPEAAEAIARRLRDDLQGYRVRVKVRRGDRPEHVKVVFEAERIPGRPIQVRLSPLLYSTHDSFSLALQPAFETHHNYFSAGFVTNASDLLERNTGWVLRYEHRQVGTSRVQIGVEYDYFKPSFQDETEFALARAPLVPGTYGTREVFAPSISVLPVPDLKVTFGVSLETLDMEAPVPFDEAARALTFGVQLRKEVRRHRGVFHAVNADYSFRDASRTLESDFLYRRHWAAAGYTGGVWRHEFNAQFQGGHAEGVPPLHERFSIGSATTLRGWDKFDVAPLGGTRLLYGSLAYRYRPFELFYDFGTVWDPALGQAADWKHSVGIGLAWRNGFFLSIGVPVRDRGVKAAFMFGFRPTGRG